MMLGSGQSESRGWAEEQEPNGQSVFGVSYLFEKMEQMITDSNRECSGNTLNC